MGISDFRDLREQNITFVDKSRLIIEFLESTQQVLLLPRPRRFGKTLNLSMLRYFLEKRPENLAHLFEGLDVFYGENALKYKKHFQQYPVIFVSFKDISGKTFDICHAAIADLLANMYREHEAILGSGKLNENETANYKAILDGKATPTRYRSALFDLCKYIHRATGQKPVVLIDEYDHPIHNGWLSGYGADVLDFFRAFLTSALKDNSHLQRALLTGVLRIARESIFSGLNNIAVYTLIDQPFCRCFGFSEDDVRALVHIAGHPEWLPTVQAWYDGYLFYDQITYNPWSVLSFLSNSGIPRAYWINTSSNDLIKRVLQERASRAGKTIETLIQGGSIDAILSSNTVLDELFTDERAFVSLLTFSGYLRAEALPMTDPLKPAPHRLSIPNAEVKLIYTEVFELWLRSRLEGRGADLQTLLSAMLSGDSELLEEQLQAFVLNVLSFHDSSPTDPESIYQAFVLGLLCILEPEYRVRSNRESGKGRPDVMILPSKPGKPGVVLELKVVRKGTLEQALERAAKQIRERDYPAEARAAGAEPLYSFAVAFDGKDLRVMGVEPIAKEG